MQTYGVRKSDTAPVMDEYRSMDKPEHYEHAGKDGYRTSEQAAQPLARDMQD